MHHISYIGVYTEESSLGNARTPSGQNPQISVRLAPVLLAQPRTTACMQGRSPQPENDRGAAGCPPLAPGPRRTSALTGSLTPSYRISRLSPGSADSRSECASSCLDAPRPA